MGPGYPYALGAAVDPDVGEPRKGLGWENFDSTVDLRAVVITVTRAGISRSAGKGKLDDY